MIELVVLTTDGGIFALDDVYVASASLRWPTVRVPRLVAGARGAQV